MKLAIIGAGPGGYSAAIWAARRGAEVTLIDRDPPGGTCLHQGCIPSKIMRRAADFMLYAKRFSEFGIDLGNDPAVNLPLLRARQRNIVEDMSGALGDHFKALGIDFIRGSARVEQSGLVSAADSGGKVRYCQYDHLLLALGSVPGAIPGLRPDGKKIIVSDQALWLEDKPSSLLVLGGGVIGCELAGIYHDFGVEVRLVEPRERLLPLSGLDAEIAKVFMRTLKKNRRPFHLNSIVDQVRETPAGLAVAIKPLSGPGEPLEMEFGKILIAAGREAVAQDMGLELIGVTFDDKGWIETGRDFKTKAGNVWAVGDCLGPSRPMLAHVAMAEAAAAVENIFGGSAGVDYSKAPAVIFTSPEIGLVGLTLAQAQAEQPGSAAADFLFRQSGKAQVIGEIDGMVRLVYGPDGVVLGGHVAGPSAGVIIAEIALAAANGLTVSDLARTIHAHPTLSETVWEAAMSATGRPLHGA